MIRAHAAANRNHVPHRCIGKLDALHRTAGVAWVVVEVKRTDDDLVRAAIDADFQIGPDALQSQIRRRHAGLEAQHIEFARTGVCCLDYGVLAIALAEKIHVVANATIERVVARSAVQRVVAQSTQQRVVCAIAEDQVVASVATAVNRRVASEREIFQQRIRIAIVQ